MDSLNNTILHTDKNHLYIHYSCKDYNKLDNPIDKVRIFCYHNPPYKLNPGNCMDNMLIYISNILIDMIYIEIQPVHNKKYMKDDTNRNDA